MPMFRQFKEKLRKTASLLPTLHNRNPMYRGNPAITILRICLWLMPAIFIPLGVIFYNVLCDFLPDTMGISLALLLILAATAAIGLFEELLTFQQMRQLPNKLKRELVVSSIVFVSLQIIIAPSVCFAFILGISRFAPSALF